MELEEGPNSANR